MNGIFIIHKSTQMTSHDVVSFLRRLLHIKRIGHAGTLDPMATGVLVVMIGKATKLSDWLLCEEKEYIAGVRLGCVTDTYDITGTILKQQTADISAQELEQALLGFQGKIFQRPPMYSAIKQNGKKLYNLARQGVEVERPLREITIHSLDMVSWSPLQLNVVCSKGTYIRSLVHDLGETLGCGACLESLCRTRSGHFTLEQSVTLEQLETQNPLDFLIPLDHVVPFPAYTVSGEVERRVRNGNPIRCTSLQSGWYKVYGADGALLCLAEYTEETLKPKTMF